MRNHVHVGAKACALLLGGVLGIGCLVSGCTSDTTKTTDEASVVPAAITESQSADMEPAASEAPSAAMVED